MGRLSNFQTAAAGSISPQQASPVQDDAYASARSMYSDHSGSSWTSASSSSYYSSEQDILELEPATEYVYVASSDVQTHPTPGNNNQEEI
jgi:hypothetical protein